MVGPAKNARKWTDDLLLERRAHGENVDDDLAALNAELDGIGAELREHDENPMKAIREAIEAERFE